MQLKGIIMINCLIAALGVFLGMITAFVLFFGALFIYYRIRDWFSDWRYNIKMKNKIKL